MQNIPPVLEQTPDILRGLLATATHDELTWRPSAERWSIAMVLAHLAEVEVKGFLHRFQALVEQEFPFLPSYDQLALFRTGSDFDAAEQLGKFENARRNTLAWLRTLPDDVRERSGRHEELGVLTFGELLNEFPFHDLGHLRQIAELYRSRAYYPNMGPFKRYYTINP